MYCAVWSYTLLIVLPKCFLQIFVTPDSTWKIKTHPLDTPNKILLNRLDEPLPPHHNKVQFLRGKVNNKDALLEKH